jgi:chaperonin GroEL
MQPQNYKNTVTFGTEATESLLAGAEIVYKAVSSTLGPKSNLVAIQHPFGDPTTIGDGVTVAKAVVQYGLENEQQDTGARLLVMAATATNDQVGDGTTTTTILAYEIVKAAHEAIKNGANAMMLRKGITKAVEDITTYLDSIKKEITEEQIKQVATISAQNEKLGEMIADGFIRLGRTGVITVEESTGSQTSMEFKEGMEFDKGYLSNYFVTSPETNEATVNKPHILVTDNKLDNNEHLTAFLTNFLETVPADGRNLVIICDGAEPMPLAMSVAQKVKGVLNLLVIQAPGNLDHKVDLLRDIAVSTGATFISREAKMSIKDVTLADLGSADHVTSNDKSTVIVDGASNEMDMQQRITLLTERMQHPDTSAFDKEKLQERLAKLTSGIGIITVGGNNEAERSEMRERAVDAVEATKAALEDGVVAGGETALLRAATAMGKPTQDSDESKGYNIVLDACKLPIEKLLSNSHLDLKLQLTSIDTDTGIDVITGKITNLIESGILDPVKVPKTALKNAASAAMQLLTVNTIIGIKTISTPKE